VAIAVNPPGEYGRSLDAATRLAVSLEAQLEVVMVEDPRLLEVARLPLTRVIDSAGRNTDLDDRTLRRAWQVERRRLDEALRRHTSGLNIHASVRTTKGRFVVEVVSVAARVDVTLVSQSRSLGGEFSAMPDGGRRAPSSARVTHPEGGRSRRPVWVILDDSAASWRAVRLAAKLAAGYRSGLLVLQTRAVTNQDDARERVQALMTHPDPPAILLSVPGSVTQAVRELRRPEGCAVLLAPRESLDAYGISVVLDMLAAASVPLILVA